MKIVVLDGYTTNPGDLSWGPLEALGECTIHDHTPAEQIVPRCQGAEALLVNKGEITRAVIEQLPALKYVGVLATGTDEIDLAAAAERGVTVTNVPAYSTDSVAEMTFALLLELTMHVGEHARSVREGRWTACRDFCYWDFPLVELSGLTLGVVGFGRIGRAVAQRALAFDMNVLAAARRPVADPPEGVRAVDLPTLLAESDVVSLHCPLTEATAGLIDAAALASMKPSAFLINCARGAVVDAAALAEALAAGRIAGAAMDVLAVEPPPAENPLLRAPNCMITPHIAWATAAARQRLIDVVVDNLRAFQQGSPNNVVN